MSDLSRELRAQLARHFGLLTPAVVRRKESSDGTTKFLLRLDDGRHIETVCIPESFSGSTDPTDADRITFCLSTQVGCAMPCAFCLTGKMGIDRNLTAGEIAGQVRVLVRELGCSTSRFNIVLMGMGEPLHNYDNTMKALRILADEHGMAVSPRRVTLSTVGVLPALERLATEPLMPNLAISLHATTEEQRDCWSRSTGSTGSRSCSTPAAGSRSSGAAHHVRIRDVEGRERHARGRAAAGAAAERDQGQSESAAAQRGRGHSVRAAVGRAVNRFARILAERGVHGIGAEVAGAATFARRAGS